MMNDKQFDEICREYRLSLETKDFETALKHNHSLYKILYKEYKRLDLTLYLLKIHSEKDYHRLKMEITFSLKKIIDNLERLSEASLFLNNNSGW